MAIIQQNNINFTNVQANPIFMVGSKFSKSDNNDGTAHFDTTLSENEIGKSFNALEIDWNGADLASAASSFANADDTAPVSTITTTGELMKGVYSPMFAKAA